MRKIVLTFGLIAGAILSAMMLITLPLQDQIAAKAKQMTEFKKMYKNPLVNIAITSLEPLPVGILFTLVTAGVLNRKRRAEGTAVA